MLAKSSNIGTILAAEKIGGDTLYSYLKKFGIGEPTGLRFPGESEGYVPPPSKWSATSFGTIAFGQGLSVTAVQAASVFATIANDGVRVAPTLVAGFTGARRHLPGRRRRRRRPASSARAPRRPCARCSSRSSRPTARRRRRPSPATASRARPVRRTASTTPAAATAATPPRSSASRPPTTPTLVVAVFLQNPRNGHFGGVLAGPVFKKVMTFGLEHSRIPPTGTVAPRIPVTW